MIAILTVGLVSCGAEEEVVTENQETEVVENNSEADLLAKIKDLHAHLNYENTGATDRTNATDLLDRVLSFESKFPDSENRLEVLQYGEAASRGLGRLSDSDKFLKLIVEENPNLENMAQYLSLWAHTKDEIGDVEASKALYQRIVDEFPDSDWASDAQGNLSVIGMSDAELLEFIEKNN